MKKKKKKKMKRIMKRLKEILEKIMKEIINEKKNEREIRKEFKMEKRKNMTKKHVFQVRQYSLMCITNRVSSYKTTTKMNTLIYKISK